MSSSSYSALGGHCFIITNNQAMLVSHITNNIMIQMFTNTNIQYKDIYKITYQGMIIIPSHFLCIENGCDVQIYINIIEYL